MKKRLLNFNPIVYLLLLFMVMTFLSSCAMKEGTRISNMSPKQKVTMAYGTYNSQFASYMSDTGYSLNADGKWVKVSHPVLSDDKRNILRQKKEILSKMYPLVKIYDDMVNGLTPFSMETEVELFGMIDDIALLIPE